uniref:Plasmid pRiA4b Orf3-like domain-containing protein n=1 Tax=Curvibacter symbiont subsp. Hydra magnipapillata TaxID=667019 RepID=C9YFF3_CURXX|nr:hypothetical protein Csp_D33090 [Curvibacter putative symbiont of Hydra magnipapillata]
MPMALRKTASIKKRKQKYAYQMLVRLVDSEPLIWRQISVPGNMTLADLDRIIQAAMGWTNSHLHLFTIDGHVYGMPDDESVDEMPNLPDDEFTLDEVLGTKVKTFFYEYDLGDGWQHQVSVQMVMIANEGHNSWPMCLAGANACPPEDVGGLGGYEEFLEAIRDPSHEEHDAMRRWCGGPFDPIGFDINSANRDIRRWLIEGE